MQENNRLHLFDIKPIMMDVEKVIQNGLNKLLVNFIERHELLEKTHKQLIQLPSIVEELNNRKQVIHISDSDTDSETDINNFGSSDFVSIKDMTENIVRDQVSSLENKLNKMEKNYDAIIPILDKLLGKITHLNDDVKELQNNRKHNQEFIYTNTIEKSSIVKSSENENIEIHISEEENSDEEDNINPLLITCTTITMKEEVDPPSIDIKQVNLDNLKEEIEVKASIKYEAEEEEEEEEEEAEEEEDEEEEEI